MKIEGSKPYSFTARPSLMDAFDKIAISQGMSRAEYIRHLMKETVKAHEKGKINVRVFE